MDNDGMGEGNFPRTKLSSSYTVCSSPVGGVDKDGDDEGDLDSEGEDDGEMLL